MTRIPRSGPEVRFYSIAIQGSARFSFSANPVSREFKWVRRFYAADSSATCSVFESGTNQSRSWSPSILSGLLHAIDDDKLNRAFRRFQLQPKLLAYRVQKRRARQVGLHAVGRDDC